MLERIFAELGPWNWMVLGFVLLILEIVVPGVFLLWIGIAALIVGALSLMLWDAAIWSWELQVVVFLALALACAFAGKKIMGRRGDDSRPAAAQPARRPARRPHRDADGADHQRTRTRQVRRHDVAGVRSRPAGGSHGSRQGGGGPRSGTGGRGGMTAVIFSPFAGSTGEVPKPRRS